MIDPGGDGNGGEESFENEKRANTAPLGKNALGDASRRPKVHRDNAPDLGYAPRFQAFSWPRWRMVFAKHPCGA